MRGPPCSFRAVCVQRWAHHNCLFVQRVSDGLLRSNFLHEDRDCFKLHRISLTIDFLSRCTFDFKCIMSSFLYNKYAMSLECKTQTQKNEYQFNQLQKEMCKVFYFFIRNVAKFQYYNEIYRNDNLILVYFRLEMHNINMASLILKNNHNKRKTLHKHRMTSRFPLRTN